MFHLLLHTFYLFVTPFVDIQDRNQGSICCMMIKCPVVLEVNTFVLLFVSLPWGNFKLVHIFDTLGVWPLVCISLLLFSYFFLSPLYHCFVESKIYTVSFQEHLFDGSFISIIIKRDLGPLKWVVSINWHWCSLSFSYEYFITNHTWNSIEIYYNMRKKRGRKKERKEKSVINR